LDRLERRPDVDGDPVGEPRALDVAPRDRRVLLVELARVDAAAVREPARHRERRVAAVRPELEHPPRAERPDQELEKAPLDRPGEHLGDPQRRPRLLHQLVEQRRMRRRVLLGVALDLGVDEVHGRILAGWRSGC
jgi:hypothetical protein